MNRKTSSNREIALILLIGFLLMHIFVGNASAKTYNAKTADESNIEDILEDVILEGLIEDIFLEGIGFIIAEDYEKAIEIFDTAIKLDPQFADAWCKKGICIRELGRNEEAITYFDEALKINPQYVDAWDSKGDTLRRLEKYEEAITCYNEVLKLNQENVVSLVYGEVDLPLRALNQKGIAFIKLGRYEEAVTCFEDALGLDPQFTVAYNNKKIVLDYLEASKSHEKEKSSVPAFEVTFAIVGLLIVTYLLRRRQG